MYNLNECSINYLKKLGGLRQYYRDEPALTDGSALDIFPNNSASFKFKQKITDSVGDDGTKAVKIIVPLHYLSIFWRTLKMPLIQIYFVKLISL